MIGVSFSALGLVRSSDALATLFRAGVRLVELAIGPEDNAGWGRELLAYRERGVTLRAHHAFSMGGRAQPFDLARDFVADDLLRRLDWLAAHGIVAYSVHAGSHVRATSRDEAYARFLERVSWLEERCRERAIELGVELMFEVPSESTRRNLLVAHDEIARFLDDTPHVKLVADLAHLAIGRSTPEQRLALLSRARDRIFEVHVSDNDGRRDLHTTISHAAWWWPHRSSLPPDVPIILESRVRNEGDLAAQLSLLSSWAES